MSVKRLTIDGFGQIELNNVAFRRDGRIEAQCKLDVDDFEDIFAENGMLLAVDNVTRSIKLPVGDGSDELIAINYSAEHIYDERTPGLKNFKLGVKDVYPRLGYLAVGDKFTTNCVSYNTTDFADDDTLKETDLTTTSVYASESEDGTILLAKGTAPTNKVTLKAVSMTTMPDGTFGIKFQVLAC